MKRSELIATFEKYDDEFLMFERVEKKLSNRPDLHAFILLDKLVPNNRDIVSAAEHDQIWLDIDIHILAKIITHEQVKELSRCGVRYDDDTVSLSLFV